MSFEELIMSKDKYPSVFPRQMEAIVFFILQIFFATRAVLKTGEYHSDMPPVLVISSHVTRLDQSIASENNWTDYKGWQIVNEARSAELDIIISYPTSSSEITVLLKNAPKI